MSASRQFNTPIDLKSAALAATHNSNTIANLFTTGGNVGIGTTSPSEVLHVNGNIRHTGFNYVSSSTLTTGSAGTVLIATASDGLYSGRISVDAMGGGGHSQFIINISGTFTEGVVAQTPSITVQRSQWVGGTNVSNITICTAPTNGTYISNFFITCATGAALTIRLLESVGNKLSLSTPALTTLTAGYTQTVYPLTGTGVLNGAMGNYLNVNTSGIGINSTGGSYTLDINGTLEASNTNGLMMFASSGNVGIGSTSPTSKLTVVGSETTANGENAAIMIQNTSATSGNKWYLRTGAVGTGTPIGGLSIADTSAYRMVFASTGNVGIANTSPAYTLDINGTFEASNANGQMLFASSGNVGIATTSPGESLDVRGNLRVGGSTKGNYIAFYGTSGDTPGGWVNTFIGERIYAGTEQSELLLFKGNDTSTGGGADRIRLLAAEHRFDTYTTNLSGTFEDVGAMAASNRMTITTAGNIGIGTATPTSTLDVVGSISKTVYNSGEVIQVKCFSSAIGTSFTTSISGAYPTNISSLSFTPKSTSSFILVHVDCTYSVPGSGSDTLQSGITIDGTTVITKTQTWYASGTSIDVTMRNNNNSLFPLMGVRTNTTLTNKTITVVAGRVSSDDTLNLSNINITITEVQQ